MQRKNREIVEREKERERAFMHYHTQFPLCKTFFLPIAARPPINAFRGAQKIRRSTENGLKCTPFATDFYNVCRHKCIR